MLPEIESGSTAFKASDAELTRCLCILLKINFALFWLELVIPSGAWDSTVIFVGCAGLNWG